MLTQNLGYPRIGGQRQIKKASENYCAGKIRKENWQTQLAATHHVAKAADLLPTQNLWVNPACGLKTRKWPETKAALQKMVARS